MSKTKPITFFKPEEEEIWGPKLLELSRARLNLSTIAGHFRCSYNTLTHNPLAMEYIRQGWSEHDEKVQRELLSVAMDDPKNYADREERTSVRKAKLDALKALHYFLNNTNQQRFWLTVESGPGEEGSKPAIEFKITTNDNPEMEALRKELEDKLRSSPGNSK